MKKTKVIATIAVFPSFKEAVEMLGKSEKVYIPENPQPGIHIVTIYDDYEKPNIVQHAIVVVVGDVGNKWHYDSFLGRSPIGNKSINRVEFEQGTIPLFIEGKEEKGTIETHSLYGPRCTCFRFEEEKREMVCIKYVEAFNADEFLSIIEADESGDPFDIVDVRIIEKFPERFLWKNDKKAMEGVQQTIKKSFNVYLVLFFKE